MVQRGCVSHGTLSHSVVRPSHARPGPTEPGEPRPICRSGLRHPDRPRVIAGGDLRSTGDRKPVLVLARFGLQVGFHGHGKGNRRTLVPNPERRTGVRLSVGCRSSTHVPEPHRRLTPPATVQGPVETKRGNGLHPDVERRPSARRDLHVFGANGRVPGPVAGARSPTLRRGRVRPRRARARRIGPFRRCCRTPGGRAHGHADQERASSHTPTCGPVGKVTGKSERTAVPWTVAGAIEPGPLLGRPVRQRLTSLTSRLSAASTPRTRPCRP